MTDAVRLSEDDLARQAQKSTTGRPALRPPTRPPWHGMPDLLRVVWTMPRATIRWLLDHGDRGLWVALALCAALVQALSSTAMWPRPRCAPAIDGSFASAALNSARARPTNS